MIPRCHSSDLHLWSCQGREKGCSLKIASLVISLAGFSLIHLIATGVSCFFGSSLLTFVIYVYCQRCQRQSQESTVIHPTTPNHLHYKGNTTPKNEKYTPMEFKVGYLMRNTTNSLILPEQVLYLCHGWNWVGLCFSAQLLALHVGLKGHLAVLSQGVKKSHYCNGILFCFTVLMNASLASTYQDTPAHSDCCMYTYCPLRNQ